MPRLLAVAAAGVIAAQALAIASQTQAEDRYGPAPAAASPTGQPSAQAAPMLLGWPGKTASTQAYTPPPAPADATAVSIYGPAATAPRPVHLRGVILADADPRASSPQYAQRQYVRPIPPPAPRPMAARPPLPASTIMPMPMPMPSPAPMAADQPPAPAPLPPAAAATPASTTTDASGHSAAPPHFYSVAREYGVKPDPDALPAQFFVDAAGSDMAAPPPPLDPREVPGSQAATAPANTASNRARETALETADAGADGPTGGAGGN